MRIKISFAGSFQCRLATDPDPTDSSPNEPAPDSSPFGTVGKGWTFAYYEENFDRIIRLSNPHALRNAMVDEWQDTRITLVEASRSLGQYMSPMQDAPLGDDILLMPVLSDPLMSQVVSLGQAKFASATPGGGTGDGHEVLEDFAFSIGTMMFTAGQVGKTKGTGVNNLGPDVGTYYKKQKTAEVEKLLGQLKPGSEKRKSKADAPKGPMHPARAWQLSEYFNYSGATAEDRAYPRNIQTLGSFFTMEANMPNIPLTRVQITGGRGVAWMTRQAGLVWKLSLNFGRFDGDTLTGKVKGVLEGSDSSR
jgi:hypothetical protein